MPWRFLKPSSGILLHPVTNWRNNPTSAWSIACIVSQNQMIWWLSFVYPFSSVYFFMSATSNNKVLIQGKRLTIEVGQSRDEHFKFFVVKYTDEVFGDELVETCQERVNLLAHDAVQVEVDPMFDVLEFVFIRDWNVPAVGDQVKLLVLAEELFVDREEQCGMVNVISLHPLEPSVELIIEVLEISERQVFSQYHLVERLSKVAVHVLSIEESLADHPSNERQIVQMIRVDEAVLGHVVGNAVRAQLEQ